MLDFNNQTTWVNKTAEITYKQLEAIGHVALSREQVKDFIWQAMLRTTELGNGSTMSTGRITVLNAGHEFSVMINVADWFKEDEPSGFVYA